MGYKGTRVPLFYRGNCQGDNIYQLLPKQEFLFPSFRYAENVAFRERIYPFTTTKTQQVSG